MFFLWGRYDVDLWKGASGNSAESAIFFGKSRVEFYLWKRLISPQALVTSVWLCRDRTMIGVTLLGLWCVGEKLQIGGNRLRSE